MKRTIKDITTELRELKDQQLELAKKEHKLQRELMDLIDDEYMEAVQLGVMER